MAKETSKLKATKEQFEFWESELVKCYQDATHLAKYVSIKSLKEGSVPFRLYDFQDKTLRVLDKNNKVIIVKARQMGISTLLALKALHRMLLNENQTVTVFANTQATAIEVVKKVKFMYNGLPEWLRSLATPINDNKLELVLSNGSLVKAFTSASESGRSQASNLVIVDEAAFIPDFKDLMTAVLPIISTGGEIVVLSSPNGTGNEFYDMWNLAENGKNGFVPIKLRWDLHPDRNQAWRDEKTAEMGVRESKQEYDAEFTGTGHTVVDADELLYIEKNTLQEPLDKGWEAKELWTWKFPELGKRYAVIVDTAKGDGGDDSTIQVIDIEKSEQVAEFQGQLAPSELAKKARMLALDYNDAVMIIESTGIGVATIEAVELLGYDNLYREPKSQVQNNNENFDRYGYVYNPSNQNDYKTGFAMTWNVRPLAVSDFCTMVRRKEIIIRSKRTFTELKTFIWLNGKAQASRGSHDDLIMPIIIYSRIRDHIFVLNNKAHDIRKAVLDNIVVSTPHLTNFNKYSPQYFAQQDIYNRFGLTDDFFNQ